MLELHQGRFLSVRTCVAIPRSGGGEDDDGGVRDGVEESNEEAHRCCQ